MLIRHANCRVLFLYQNLRNQQLGCLGFLTHCAIMSHESGESLLIGEVRHKLDGEGVSGGGDDPLGRYRLGVRLLPPTEESQRLSVRLHLHSNTAGQRNYVRMKNQRSGSEPQSSDFK